MASTISYGPGLSDLHIRKLGGTALNNISFVNILHAGYLHFAVSSCLGLNANLWG